MPITNDSLRDFLASHPKGYTSSMGLKIGRSKWGIFTHASFPSEIYNFISEEGFFEKTIVTDGDSEWSFIHEFKLESIQQIDLLSYQHCWMRYLNGGAEIILKLIPFDFELIFRIWNYKTIVYCPNNHFYDEVYEHLTIEEDFERYILKHQDFLLDRYNENS